MEGPMPRYNLEQITTILRQIEVQMANGVPVLAEGDVRYQLFFLERPE